MRDFIADMKKLLPFVSHFEESDFIQAELYKNNRKIVEQPKDIVYYDDTNSLFMLGLDWYLIGGSKTYNIDELYCQRWNHIINLREIHSPSTLFMLTL